MRARLFSNQSPVERSLLYSLNAKQHCLFTIFFANESRLFPTLFFSQTIYLTFHTDFFLKPNWQVCLYPINLSASFRVNLP